MSDSEQIEQVINQYIEAIKKGDMPALKEICTMDMLKQFSQFARFNLYLYRLFFPARWKSLVIKDLCIESQEEHKAIVNYNVKIGRRYSYERVVLLKQNNRWMIDGKFV